MWKWLLIYWNCLCFSSFSITLVCPQWCHHVEKYDWQFPFQIPSDVVSIWQHTNKRRGRDSNNRKEDEAKPIKHNNNLLSNFLMASIICKQLFIFQRGKEPTAAASTQGCKKTVAAASSMGVMASTHPLPLWFAAARSPPFLSPFLHCNCAKAEIPRRLCHPQPHDPATPFPFPSWARL